MGYEEFEEFPDWMEWRDWAFVVGITKLPAPGQPVPRTHPFWRIWPIRRSAQSVFASSMGAASWLGSHSTGA